MRVLLLLVLTLLPLPSAYGQATAGCRTKEKVEGAPRYHVGWKTYSVRGPRTLFLAVSVEPRHFNREALTALARRLSNDYCREQRLAVTLFDDRRAAREFYPTSETEWFKRHVRGYYDLDRGTGEETVGFSSVPGKPVDEVKISLGRGAV